MEGSRVELRTGIKKAPRYLKFPEPQEMVEGLKKYLPKEVWAEALALSLCP